ncbi:MAG: ABC transporter permease [Dehalococcoidia bacterium]|nr:ABC transporter permease [Dehalococcoidia bacterium]
MLPYIIRRVVMAIPVFVGVSIITFSIMQLAPGDPAAILLGGDFLQIATPEDIAAARAALGVDRPAIVQYLDWMSGFFTGDLGTSLFTGKSVSELISPRIEPTVAIIMTGIFIAIIFGIPMGIVSAWKSNTWIDRVVMVFAVIGFSMPGFWLAFNLIWLFSVNLGWTPVFGYASVSEGVPQFFRHLVLPAISIGVAFMALNARMTRSSMLEVLRDDYIRTARAKGLIERVVLFRHALRAASMPIVTIIGLSFAGAVTGAVLTETVFAIPGMGRLFVGAVSDRDFPVIQGLMMIFAGAYVFVNLAVDILYAYLDPRVRY